MFRLPYLAQGRLSTEYKHSNSSAGLCSFVWQLNPRNFRCSDQTQSSLHTPHLPRGGAFLLLLLALPAHQSSHKGTAELKTQREVPTNATLPMQPSSTSRLLQFLLGSFAAWFCTGCAHPAPAGHHPGGPYNPRQQGSAGGTQKKSRGMALELMTANLHCFGHWVSQLLLQAALREPRSSASCQTWHRLYVLLHRAGRSGTQLVKSQR